MIVGNLRSRSDEKLTQHASPQASRFFLLRAIVFIYNGIVPHTQRIDTMPTLRFSIDYHLKPEWVSVLFAAPSSEISLKVLHSVDIIIN